MDYNGYVTALSTLTAIAESDPNFVAILPEAINYSEQRIASELEKLAAPSKNC